MVAYSDSEHEHAIEQGVGQEYARRNGAGPLKPRYMHLGQPVEEDSVYGGPFYEKPERVGLVLDKISPVPYSVCEETDVESCRV